MSVIFMDINTLKKLSPFSICILILLLLSGTAFFSGCVSSRKTKPPVQKQIQREWENKHLTDILEFEVVQRKDIAFLLVYYFNDLLPFFEENPDTYPIGREDIFDIIGLEEGPYISDALKMGWMRNFPDGQFYPHDEVRRFHFALILFNVSRNLPLFQGSSVTDIEIKDVSYSDYTYNAIIFAVSNRLMKLKDGYFFENKNLTGYEAARAFSEFRKILKK
jgi:hypothetical protein